MIVGELLALDGNRTAKAGGNKIVNFVVRARVLGRMWLLPGDRREVCVREARSGGRLRKRNLRGVGFCAARRRERGNESEGSVSRAHGTSNR